MNIVRPSPPIWGLLVLLVGMCISQLLRLTRDGMAVADAASAIIIVVAVITGLPLLILVLLGARNRKLVARLRDDDRDGVTTFAIFFSPELRDALQPFLSSANRGFNKHGVMRVSRAGVHIWSAQKHGPATPVHIATIPSGNIIAVAEESIPIAGGGFWGLSLETLVPDGSEVVTLPIGLTNRSIAAFFPSRREVQRSHAQILELISPAAARA
ncbi:hypothetical protein [Agromyces sp. NPDC057865]|uniref:hypothetical protein n=1 Tax=Agromyces sp. NPDC057865 TaxID=3346267 RepID=UPI00366F3582